MGGYDLILIPFLFGLVGFVEPCSLGINVLFLNYIHKFKRIKRVSETLIFTLARGFVLALIGLSAAFIGTKFIKIQTSLFVILGILYIILGILSIINMYKPIFGMKWDFSRFIKKKTSLSLGLAFGLVIPACAIALVLALLGKTLLVGDLFGGFISLFVFGVTLSLPLVFICYFEKSTKIIQNIYNKAKRIPWLTGAILILIGILTFLTSSWWLKAIQ